MVAKDLKTMETTGRENVARKPCIQYVGVDRKHYSPCVAKCRIFSSVCDLFSFFFVNNWCLCLLPPQEFKLTEKTEKRKLFAVFNTSALKCSGIDVPFASCSAESGESFDT